MSSTSSRLGPIRLADGVRPSHAGVYLLSAFAAILMTTFISTIQPYILEVNLGLPADEQGTVSGDMVFYGELVLLAFSSLIGALSDRIGRRAVFTGGVLILAAGYYLYALVDNVTALTAVRVFLACGIAAVNVMVGAIQADYPEEQSRGKLVGFTGVAIGLGAVLIGVFLMRLPAIYAGAGASELEAGQYTLYTMACVGLTLALIIAVGLKGGRPPHANPGDSLATQFSQGFAAGRANPRIMLAYLCAFVARADLVVVGTFFTLWLTQEGIQSGMTPEKAAGTAGGFFGFVMLCALIWAPIMGWLNDRLDRVKAMALALILAALGYLSMALIPDPLGFWMFPAGALLGIGQMSAVTASQTLIGQESPPAYRGSVIGMFSFFGAAGILFVTSVGGRLYDAIGPATPFVLVGTVNGLLFFWALLLARRSASAHTA